MLGGRFRSFAKLTALGAVLAMGLPALSAAAQEGTGLVSPILLLDQEALYSRSQFGQNLRAELTALAAEVEAESRRLDRVLEAEEQALTQKRGQMSPEEFAPLAAEFDARVQRLRTEREAAADDLRAREVAGRQRFFEAAGQIILDYMVERGAVAIVDKGAIIAHLSALDVTNEVIAKLDAVLGKGDSLPP